MLYYTLEDVSMKKYAILIVALFVLPFSNGMAEQTSTPAEGVKVSKVERYEVTDEYRDYAKKIFKIFNYQGDFEMIFKNVSARVRRYEPDVPEKFFTNIEDGMDPQPFVEAQIQLYAEVFSLEDLKKMHEFYSSKTFKKYQIVGEGLMMKLSAINDDYYAKILKVVYDKMSEAKYKIPEFLERAEEERILKLQNQTESK